MKHRFTLTYQTRGTAKQARDSLLDALTSGGLHEPDIRLVAKRKKPRKVDPLPRRGIDVPYHFHP